MTESIAFLGIGLMGGPMAANLIQAGHDMTIWNRSPEKTAPLAELGSKVATSASEAISEATIVILMLESGSIVEKVIFDSGAAEAVCAGALVVDVHEPRIVARDFKTHGRSGAHLKDKDNAGNAAQMLELSDLPYTGIAVDLFRELLGSSGDLDHAALSIGLQNRNPVVGAGNRA